jgi:hypothetical protein
LTDIARCERAPMLGMGRYDAAYVVTVSGHRIRVPLLQSSVFRRSSEQLDDEITGLQHDIAHAVASG